LTEARKRKVPSTLLAGCDGGDDEITRDNAEGDEIARLAPVERAYLLGNDWISHSQVAS